jgi:hypothetical protein
MPNTRLILHVKGTQAETAELPKDVVRAAISQGQLTHSQLIWSPADNAWKQVRELPELLPGESLILHVKGTEAETRELPKQAVRAAISQGEITHSQLIWSPGHNTWKQVRELPDLLPSQKLAPAPARAAAVPVPKAVEAIIPESPSNPVARAAAAADTPTPQVRMAVASPPPVRVAAMGRAHVRVAATTTPISPARVAATAGTPQVRVAAAAKPAIKGAVPVSAPSTRDMTVHEDEGFHPLKWVCIGLGVLILLVLGGNYFLVDQPLRSKLAQTPYADVTVHAHFGAFMQPNVMVIHIPVSSTITPDKLVDFLVTLAHSTPQDPITRDLFERVALTSAWTAQYSFSGYGWKELGEMQHESETQRKEFLMEQMGDAGGQPLMPESTLNEAAQQATSDQVWETFVAHFTAKQ